MITTSRDPDRTVMVSGIGAILPGVQDTTELWDVLRHGRSQCGWLTRCDPRETGVPFAAEVDHESCRRQLRDLDDAKAAKLSREMLAVLAAVKQAQTDAGRSDIDTDPQRIAVLGASSRGPLETWHSVLFPEAGSSPPGASRILRGLPGAPAAMAAINLGFRGMVTTFGSACVSGHHALELGLGLLWSATADVVFVVGHEFPLVPWMIREWASAGDGVVAKSGTDPTRVVKPYDERRGGFILGEGAVALCLERAIDVRRRGAGGYATVLDVRNRSEAAHPTSMDSSGKAAADLLGDLLDAVGRQPEEVGYICGHGTATRLNDVAESRAVMRLCQALPRSQWPPLGSVKPIFGHLMGAASLVNLAATALMVRHQRLVPTINCDRPDPACDLDHVAEGSRSVSIDLALSMCFALGSQMSAVALGSADATAPT
ncbi:beta-ketoacyl synthase N-terminal-like domain-containing protein [Amycolatopsis mediterranei]|uniref:beta-ketoacyl-[acyl-carrier-protein] synthase family protein n=1 Tax=Amycolatopsis mediterranei TaxID=33910 RepID=UPI003427E8D0